MAVIQDAATDFEGKELTFLFEKPAFAFGQKFLVNVGTKLILRNDFLCHRSTEHCNTVIRGSRIGNVIGDVSEQAEKATLDRLFCDRFVPSNQPTNSAFILRVTA